MTSKIELLRTPALKNATGCLGFAMLDLELFALQYLPSRKYGSVFDQPHMEVI